MTQLGMAMTILHRDETKKVPGEKGALAVGGVRHGAEPAEVDGDSFGARLPEPVREPRRAAVLGGARLPQPLRARRHRRVEHRQHLRPPHQAVITIRASLRLWLSSPRTLPLPRARELANRPEDFGMAGSGSVAGLYCGGTWPSVAGAPPARGRREKDRD